MISILLVDDQEQVRRGLHMRLSLEPDFEIVGEAEDGLEALYLAAQLCPAVLIVDVEMTRLDGIGLVQRLRSRNAVCGCVILSLHDDEETRRRAMAAGADAYLSKRGDVAELIAVVRQAAHLRLLAEEHPPKAEPDSPSCDGCLDDPKGLH